MLWQSLLSYLNSSSEYTVYVVPQSVTNQNLDQMSAAIRFQQEEMDKLLAKRFSKQRVKKSANTSTKKMTKQANKQKAEKSNKRPAQQRIQPTRKSKQVKRNATAELENEGETSDESSWSGPDSIIERL